MSYERPFSQTIWSGIILPSQEKSAITSTYALFGLACCVSWTFSASGTPGRSERPES